MQFDIASGKSFLFAKNVQSMVTVGDCLYLLQFERVPFTNREHAHKLKKWAPGNEEPITVVEDFPYERLSASERGRWLLGGSANGYGQGTAIYDAKTGHIERAGKSCDMAIATASGGVSYTFGAALVTAPAASSVAPPPQEAGQPRRS